MYTFYRFQPVSSQSQPIPSSLLHPNIFILKIIFIRIVTSDDTRHKSADSVPTSNLVCIKEVASRTTFCVAGITYYTCDLVINIRCTRYKNAFNKRF